MTQPQSVPIFILAGGYGTRLSEETSATPKPMIEIGGIPILVHIMRKYYAHGFNDFAVCAGYRAFDIKKYFMTYQYHLSDIELDLRGGHSAFRPLEKSRVPEQWRVRVIDTGLDTMTGGRVARAFDTVQELSPFETFGLTYGDGLCDADLGGELRYHLEHGRVGTVLGVKNVARYGELDVTGEKVAGFLEKPESRQGYISGGFFFFKKELRSFLSTEEGCILEGMPLSTLAAEGQLMVHKHHGFWQAMDTLRDKNQLQALWATGNAPWLPGKSGPRPVAVPAAELWDKTDRRALRRKTG